MIDGMSIRKLLDWDPKRQQMVGFVDLGAGSLDNDVAEAIEVIVIMAVGLQDGVLLDQWGALHALQETNTSVGTARWTDIVRLQELQASEGLHAANKLTTK
ncbi:hypothetical protein LSH36_65g12009 [Paralvinella palmiformis]|uniref:Transposable element P transposase-like RNase H domain-containing protein n=1 Tax=Paralvinella palmiformis TaxID=53620 RepID=A0AAD9K434_9ANNE|nr:hypothetical protein LSH36_65g12009 [Paralvinella palmiformis]